MPEDNADFFDDLELAVLNTHRQVEALIKRKPAPQRNHPFLLVPPYLAVILAFGLITRYGWNDNGGIYTTLYITFALLTIVSTLAWVRNQKTLRAGYEVESMRAIKDMTKLMPVARKMGQKVIQRHARLLADLMSEPDTYMSVGDFLKARDDQRRSTGG